MSGNRAAITAAAIFGAATLTLHAQQGNAGSARANGADLRVIPIRGNVYLISGGGGNITASIGKDGVMLVDTGAPSMTDAVLSVVRALGRQVTAFGTPQRSCVGVVQGCTWWNSSNLLPTTVGPPAPRPIAFIINTSLDADHIGGNEKIAAAGRTFGAPASVPLGARIVAHENVSARLSPAGQPTVADGALPDEVYFGDEKKLNFFNGEGVVIAHVAAAHTDGDSMVYFRGSDVIAAGDVFNMANYPVIDTKNGGSINGIIAAANKLLDMIVWEHMMEGGTMVVPGHGRLADVADVGYYRDMVTILRDRVLAMKNKGMTLAQIKGTHLTKDYDPRFGRNPQWTPEMFVEAIYNTLGAAGR